MPLFQQPATTPEEIDASRPLATPPDAVLEMDEAEWYRRIYRRDAPQLTVRSVVMGNVLGFFLAFTNVYIGLKTGWFIGVNLTACILSYGIWTSFQRAGLAKTQLSILENTSTVSTASSAGYATGSIVISAIPAMLLLSVTADNPGGVQLGWPVMGAWVFFVGVLGVMLAIPMKRGMINRDKLRFPSGTAAAVTLQGLYSRGAEALARARALAITAVVSGVVPIVKELDIRKVGVDAATGKTLRDTLLPGQSNVFDWIATAFPALFHRMAEAGPPSIHAHGLFKPSDYQLKLDHGVALVFAGVIIGVRITFWMVVGGLLLSCALTPPALDARWINAAGIEIGASALPGTAWKEIGIWFGAPMLVAGGLVAFVAQWRTIVNAIAGVVRKDTTAPGDEVDPRAVEVPASWFAGGVVFAGIGVVTVARIAFAIPLRFGVLAVLMTFVLALVACRATGESDITPGGAMGKLMQLTYGVLIPQSSAANLQTAAITSGSSLAAADLLNDLKCGYLLGANPRRQFVAQALGIVTGTIATTLCYFVLVPDASVLTGTANHPPAFPAPSAQQWRAVAEVFKVGLGNLHPMSRTTIFWGLAVGTVLGLAEVVAPKGVKRWLPSVTGLGLGFTLPFFYPLALFLGAIGGEILKRTNRTWAERYLIAIAAGGIAGESIVGVVVQALNNFVLH